MNFRQVRKIVVPVCLGLAVIGVSAGLSCQGNNNSGGDLSPVPPEGNRPPRILITEVSPVTVFQGEDVTITFTASDPDNVSIARVFASTTTNPTSDQEILIQSGIEIQPPDDVTVPVVWHTTDLLTGTYFVFAEIDDQTGINPPVRAVAAQPIAITLPGSTPLTFPPQIVFIDPLPNLGLSSQDEVTIRYIYADVDSSVKVTLLLDKDTNPTNDDIDNPGNPSDPDSKIIILPSTARLASDPTFADPADTNEIRTNPRTLPQTAPGVFPFPGAPLAGALKEYRFTVDLSMIPVREQPYYIRATISDGNDTVHAYATGSLTISALASGTVDLGDMGFHLAGARFQGFSTKENLGTQLIGIPDMDGDGQDEMMIASRFASPKNRLQPGAAYLIFGRRKTPFPPDANGDGVPDGFPTTPTYLPSAYNSNNIGRFGGIVSINSVSSFFRGTTYAMPMPRVTGQTNPPAPTMDPTIGGDADHPSIYTAGLTSITRVDFNNDGIPELIFGLPFISGAWDHVDDDPADGCGNPNQFSTYNDVQPNWVRCTRTPFVNDNLGSNTTLDLDQGLVIAVDGKADLRNIFRKVVDAGIAGQFDPNGAVDDESIINSPASTPNGFRIRGGWHPNTFPFPIVHDNEYGTTVAAIPSLNNDLADELLISNPGQFGQRGTIEVWYGQNNMDGAFYGVDGVKSLPAYTDNGPCGIQNCTMDDPPFCQRGCFRPPEPIHQQILGQSNGDRLGYAGSAGDFNQDGVPDILAGAPTANRNTLSKNGVFYIFATPQGGIGDIDLSVNPPPRIVITGTHNNDKFGLNQTQVRDVDGDGISDVAFSSEFFTNTLAGQGYVGVIFGNRPITGELGFTPLQVGTPVLHGVKFFGAVAGAAAGHRIATAGDFNSDGFGDLLISCPGEARCVAPDGSVSVAIPTSASCAAGSEKRVGVVYLIFGGRHLSQFDQGGNIKADNSFNLSQVGTAVLPGVIFFGRVHPGDQNTDPNADNNASLETVGGVGDVDGDGFDDVLIGAPHVDFVDTASPNQRRTDAGETYLIYGSNFGSNNLCNVQGYCCGVCP